MKQMIAVFACLLTAVGWGNIARAGVVIDEQVTTIQGSTPAVSHTRELLVQGDKEKMVSDRNVFVIDLDKGTMMLIDPKQKAYAEMPFPPHGNDQQPRPAARPQFQKDRQVLQGVELQLRGVYRRRRDCDGFGFNLRMLLDQRARRRRVHGIHPGDGVEAQQALKRWPAKCPTGFRLRWIPRGR